MGALNKENLRIVFMGTPEFAVGTLSALIDGGYNVVAVVTQPDKPVGRHGSVLRAPAVKEYALSKGIPVLQPEKMKDPAFVEQLRSYRPQLQVVVAFRMLPEVVWAMPEYGTFNVHAALLPLYRGAAPINWAIINGETETGVTTFFLDHDIDTGRIIMQKKFPIPDDADVEYVYDGLMKLGAEAAIETVDAVIKGNGVVESVPQSEWVITKCEGNFEDMCEGLPAAPKIFKDNSRIEWNQPTKTVYDFVRGLSPIPTAWTELQPLDAEQSGAVPLTMKVFRTRKVSQEECGKFGNAEPGTVVVDRKRLFVATSDGFVELLDIQLAGKKRMLAADFLNGFHIQDYRFV